MACRDKIPQTTVDYLLNELRSDGGTLKPAEVVATLQLASLGCGEFTSGRHGKPSRMSWNFDLPVLARIALGEHEPVSSVSWAAFAAAEEATSQQRASPARSAATESYPWCDILNERD